MPKYLLQGSYTEKGLSGLLKDGGSKRREAVEQLAKGLGGKLEVFYFGFGGDDFFIILDLPGNVEAAAGALTTSATGAVKLRTTVLVTPEEIDQATKRTVNYRAPGQ